MSQALTLQPCTLVCFLALTHVRQGTWEDGAKKEECKRRFNRRNHTSICYSSAEAVGPRKHLHVCKCFLWNSIMFLLVDSNPQCHRGNLCAIVDLCFTRPGGNHVFDPVHTSVYYSICHYWNMCSASQLRTSVFSLRFANGVFLKGSVKQAGKIMSRQKIDAQLFCWKCYFSLSALLSGRLGSPVWLPWCLSPLSPSLTPVFHCLSPSYVPIYSPPALPPSSQSVFVACCCVLETWSLLSELSVEY